MAFTLRRFVKKSSLIKKLKWELEYLVGTWKFLDSSMEDERYQNIIELMAGYGPASPAILEMGCGEGLTLKKMEKVDFRSFLGVDLSHIAIRKAIAKKFAKASFEPGAMDTWEADQKFDIIIFNESIYYSKDPVALMEKYSRWLTPGGRIIISIYIMDPTKPVVDRILKAYKPLATREARNKMGLWQEFIFGF